MGVPGSTNSDLFHSWARLPITREQSSFELKELMSLHFPDCKPLPGSEELLLKLSRARSASTGDEIDLALASNSKSQSYQLKTLRPETSRLLGFFKPDRRVLGDDPRLEHGRTKPAPDIYLAALQSINSTISSNTKAIDPNECLVFEDSVAGVEAGRRAGMRVVWVPHPDLAAEYRSKEKAILAGRTEIFELGDNWQLGEIDDGWAESIPSLKQFNYEKYGIDVAPETP